MTMRAETDKEAKECVQTTPEGPNMVIDASKWLCETVKVPVAAQALLEQYSGFRPEEVIPHVTNLRARAFKIRPYPCIGQPIFPDLIASRHPAYAEILAKLQSGNSFLDAGCCLGQDLRKLLFDGAPSSGSLYGLDLEPAFFDLGYELFRDRHSMHATFITADLTNPSIPSIEPFVSSVDIISAHSVFHLFNLKDQRIVAEHLVGLTKPKAGSMIFGLHIGTMEAVERHAIFDDAVVFFHNVESFDRLWQDVGAATGSKWRVDARAEQIPEVGRSQAWCKPDTTLFVFTARRE